MTKTAASGSPAEYREKLIRVRAKRGKKVVDLRVHYGISRSGNCDTYRIIAVDDVGQSTITD